MHHMKYMYVYIHIYIPKQLLTYWAFSLFSNHQGINNPNCSRRTNNKKPRTLEVLPLANKNPSTKYLDPLITGAWTGSRAGGFALTTRALPSASTSGSERTSGAVAPCPTSGPYCLALPTWSPKVCATMGLGTLGGFELLFYILFRSRYVL